MINIIIWFVGVISTTIYVAATPNCDITNSADGKEYYANCFNRTLFKFPQGLGKNLKVLNISSNPILKLLASETKDYPELIELNMHSLKKILSGKFDPNFLQPLQKLEILNISNTIVHIPPLNLPTNITKFYSSSVPRTIAFLDLSPLQKLSLLDMNNCSLHTLHTRLSKEAPLTEIRLQHNYLDKLRYNDFAPYCLLKTLYMLPLDSYTEESFNHCCYIYFWLEDHKIAHTLECSKNSTLYPCNKKKYYPDAQVVALYDQCLVRNGLLKTSIFWIAFIIFILMIIILLVAFFSYKYYQYYKSRKAAD